MSEQAKPQMTAEEVKALGEIHISFDLKGIVKGWNKMFYEAPFAFYQKIMRGAEGVSKKMMTGNASLLSMPVGIIIRNTARAAHNSSEGRYFFGARIVGGLTAAAAVAAGTLFGGPLLAAALPAVVSGFIGSVGSYIVAGAATALFGTTPAFTVGTLTASSLVGAAVAGLSTLIAAPVNLVVAYRRSKASMKGFKFTEKDLEDMEAEFDRESPSARYEREMLNSVHFGLRNLPADRRREVYETLKSDFAKAAERQEEEQTATAAAAPKEKQNPKL